MRTRRGRPLIVALALGLTACGSSAGSGEGSPDASPPREAPAAPDVAAATVTSGPAVEGSSDLATPGDSSGAAGAVGSTDAGASDAGGSPSATTAATSDATAGTSAPVASISPAPAGIAWPDDGCSPDNSPTAAAAADGPAPALALRAESAGSRLPDLAVRRINCNGGWVNLKNELPADRPLLVWFWAPH